MTGLLVRVSKKFAASLFGRTESGVNEPRIEAKYNALLAEAIALDDEYTKMTNRYIDGRINRAQENYYRMHPQFLSWYYIAVQNAWRCWSLQFYMSNDAQIPAKLESDEQIEPSMVEQYLDDTYWQSAPSVWSQLGCLKVTESMVDAIRDDRSRIKQDIAENRSVFRPTRDWWQEVNVESDELLRSALDEWLPKDSTVAVFGSTIPIAEVECLDREVNEVICLGPNSLQFDCEGISSGSEEAKRGQEKPTDCLVVTERLASIGMDPSEKLDPDADLKQLATLRDRLADRGLLILVLPTASTDGAILNVSRIYGPKRLKKVFEGFDLKKTYRPESAVNAPNGFAICVYVMQKNDSQSVK